MPHNNRREHSKAKLGMQLLVTPVLAVSSVVEGICATDRRVVNSVLLVSIYPSCSMFACPYLEAIYGGISNQ